MAITCPRILRRVERISRQNQPLGGRRVTGLMRIPFAGIFESRMVSQLRRVAITVLSIYWLALFLGTHLPLSGKGMGDHGDKLIHFLAFAGLAFLMSVGIGGRHPTWRAYLVVLSACALYGGFDEFSQLFVGRHCDVWDWIADVGGTATGLLAYWIVTLVAQAWRPAVDPNEPGVALR